MWPPRTGPLAEREFRLLFVGQLVSLLGSAVAPIALAFAVLDPTASATDLGFVLAAAWVPPLLLVLFGGVFFIGPIADAIGLSESLWLAVAVSIGTVVAVLCVRELRQLDVPAEPGLGTA